MVLELDRDRYDDMLPLYNVSDVPAVQQIWVHPMAFWSRAGGKLRDAERVFSRGNLTRDVMEFGFTLDGVEYKKEKDGGGRSVSQGLFFSTGRDGPMGINNAIRRLLGLDTSCSRNTFVKSPCRDCVLLGVSIRRLEHKSLQHGKSKLHEELWKHISWMKSAVAVRQHACILLITFQTH
jgi:hypothetical protein